MSLAVGPGRHAQMETGRFSSTETETRHGGRGTVEL